jgi:poly(A) polymerase
MDNIAMGENRQRNMNQAENVIVSEDNESLLKGSCPLDVQIAFERRPFRFAESSLDIDALKVVHRLKRFGFETYLVGGCVRDLLLGAVPKDFDVVTSARPAEIKALFRNCRLIGRRFRLAHLHFKDQKIIEVATFRREPLETDDLTTRHAAQNLFGTAADDALRRDFTVNSLMYDVENGEILDWVGGLKDIENRVIRAIGAPQRRLPEDPVRIIRAIKFSLRLNLNIEQSLHEQMVQHASLLTDCSKARLLEELFKILRSGYAAPCLAQLESEGVLSYILPEFCNMWAQLENPSWELLAKADEWVLSGRAVSDSFLLAVLLYPVLADMIWESNDVAKAVSAILKSVVTPLQFTKKHMTTVRNAYIVQRRMVKGPRNKRTRRLVERDYAPEAIELLDITDKATGAVIGQWRKLVAKRVGMAMKSVAVLPRAARRRPPVKRTRTPKKSAD